MGWLLWEAGVGNRAAVSGRMNEARQTDSQGRQRRTEREGDRYNGADGRTDGRTIAFNVFRKNFSLRFRWIFCAKGNCRRVADETEAVLLTINSQI